MNSFQDNPIVKTDIQHSHIIMSIQEAAQTPYQKPWWHKVAGAGNSFAELTEETESFNL